MLVWTPWRHDSHEIIHPNGVFADTECGRERAAWTGPAHVVLGMMLAFVTGGGTSRNSGGAR